MLLFLLIFFGVFFSTHAYVWFRLVRAPALPLLLATLATAWLGLGAVGGPLALFSQRAYSPEQVRPWLGVALFWLGTFFLLFVCCAAVDACTRLLLAAAPLIGNEEAHAAASPERRLWLLRAGAAFAVTVAAALSFASRRRALGGAHVVPVAVTLARWPEALNGLRIAHLSDLHVAPLLGRAYVEQVVRRTLATKPDLIVLTGDFVDGSVANLADDVAPLRDLQAPLGVYFVTGNHEYYSGVDAWLAHFRTLGVQPLRNEHVRLSKDGATFTLAGIDDWTARNFGGDHGADLPKALLGRAPKDAVVLLAHQPKAIYEAGAAQVDLVLSGHTHGGQIWPFGYLVRLAQPYLSGLYTHSASTKIYVNPGTGYWGPPMRLGTSAEIALLTVSNRAVTERPRQTAQ